jgi:hypothetical protein
MSDENCVLHERLLDGYVIVARRNLCRSRLPNQLKIECRLIGTFREIPERKPRRKILPNLI